MRLDIGIEGDVQAALRCAVAPDFGGRTGFFLFRRPQHRPGLLAIQADQDRIG